MRNITKSIIFALTKTKHMSNLEKLREPLQICDIDFRIQSINNGKYATILAYKDARVDMNRLDEVVGAGFWKRKHFDNNRCRVSIYNKEIKEWVHKEDIGTESKEEKEKGLASDSFKRACFNWGIGRELYDYPVIQVLLNDNEITETGRDRPKYQSSYNLKLRDWKWISEFKDGKLIALACKDLNNRVRFNWGVFSKPIEPTKIEVQLSINEIKLEVQKLTDRKKLIEFYQKLEPSMQANKEIGDLLKAQQDKIKNQK